MGNPEKIEIEGLKTIHKLCKFGADHNMEGCTFTEIVERMFSKIEQMKTQVNTLDEMLLNQGEALAGAKAQAVPEGFVFVSKTPSLKVLDRLYAEHDIDEERATYIYRDIIDAQEPAKAQAVPEGFVVCKSEPVAYIVQNKFWKQKFDVKSVKDMPPQKWEDDHYDVEIPLYAVSLDGLVLKEQDEDEAND